MAIDDPIAAALRAACAALGALAPAQPLAPPLQWPSGQAGAPPAPLSGLQAAESAPFAAADLWAAWVERAAICEYEGGLSRNEAERLTATELGPCPTQPHDW